jgi:hypothetical protein
MPITTDPRKNQNIHELLRNRLHERAGLLDAPKTFLRLEDLERSEWSADFERYMRNRLIMRALRYGVMSKKRTQNYDYVNDAIRRLQEYQRTGNSEQLVDVANLCLLAFEFDKHPTKHFSAGDDGEHCKSK